MYKLKKSQEALLGSIWWLVDGDDLMESFIISHILLGGMKGQGLWFQISLDIGGLYLPFGGLSLPLYLEAVTTFESHYFPWTITIDYFSYIVHGVLV